MLLSSGEFCPRFGGKYFERLKSTDVAKVNFPCDVSIVLPVINISTSVMVQIMYIVFPMYKVYTNRKTNYKTKICIHSHRNAIHARVSTYVLPYHAPMQNEITSSVYLTAFNDRRIIKRRQKGVDVNSFVKAYVTEANPVLGESVGRDENQLALDVLVYSEISVCASKLGRE